ncbi:MAG: hypothetical protein IE910_06710 [Brevundimonas sp.]|nr:hypothetical protein [Brevundimonas sp.]
MSKAKAKAPTAPKYEQRLTLFIDFLGFKEHVARTEEDPTYLSRVICAMDRIAAIGRDDKAFHKSQVVTQFSDCVVVSYGVDEESGVFWLLNEIAFCVVDLVEEGFLVRGAVTVGDLFHTKSHVVGPAMIEAYLLESKVAKFPRVLIEEKVLEVAKAARRDGHSVDEELDYVRSYMTTDDDGRDYLNYVSWNSVVAVTGGDNDLYPAYLEKISELVEAGLNHQSVRVLPCYLWLHTQYLEARDGIANLPKDHPYRLQDPEICDNVASLPRLDALAAQAKTRVDAGSQPSVA